MSHTVSVIDVPSIGFITLGCAKNEVDSAHMKELLLSAGFTIAEDLSEAQAIIVNTCSFIQAATEESLEAIFDASSLPNVVLGAPLIVAGCMPSRYGAELEGELTEAQAFVPCSKEHDIVSVVGQVLGLDDTELHQIKNRMPDREQKSESYTGVDSSRYSAYSGSAFAYVKISDGCNRGCTFCTIPRIRGRYRSYPYEDIRAEVEQRVSEGVKEIDLIAQDTGRWGDDFEAPRSLAWLMDQLANEFSDTWFRVMYIQPEMMSDELLQVVVSHDNICNYFDIPLQHVDENLLRAMNRKGSYEEFVNLVTHIRNVVPQVTLRTTLIAGFPGETEDQFERLCDFVSEGHFDYIGVFPYSQEDGTKAAQLEDQIGDEIKQQRAQTLRDLCDDVCVPQVALRIGSIMPVLVEGREEDGQLFGRAMCQAPEVDGVTYLTEARVGDVVEVKIDATLLYEMEGEVVSS